MEVFALSSLCLIGAAGGVVNALLTGNLRLWPLIVRVTARTYILRPGLGVNIGFGAVAVAAVFWACEHATCAPSSGSLGSGLLTVVSGMFVGLLAARWITNETDKRFLRAAFRKACTAPAAHPDTVRTIGIASPYELYLIADDLMPRHGS